jgi:DNA-binding IclR family transcriptional regulator
MSTQIAGGTPGSARGKGKQARSTKNSRAAPRLATLDDESDRQFATTLARGLEVLRCFSALEPELTNKEISARTGLPKPTVSRLTYTLTRLGYLRHLPHAGKYGKYGLGTAVLSIGYPLLANMNVRQIARRPMKELADYARGWVSIGLRERLNMVYIETARSPEVLTNSRADIGQTFSIMTSAMGRAYLAGLSKPDRTAVMNQIKVKDPVLWKAYAPRMEKSLADFTKWGFSLGYGDINPMLQAVAVPMRRTSNDYLMVFNCAVRAPALAPHQLENDLGPRLIKMVRSIEDALDNV